MCKCVRASFSPHVLPTNNFAEMFGCIFKNVDFSNMTLTELKEVAKLRGIKGYSKMKKEELVNALN